MNKLRLGIIFSVVLFLFLLILILVIFLNTGTIRREKKEVTSILQGMQYTNHNKDLMDLTYLGYCSDNFYNETYEEHLDGITEEEELVEYINTTIIEIEDYYPNSGYQLQNQCEEDSLNEALNELSEIVKWFNEESIYEEEYYKTEEYQREKEWMLDQSTEGSLIYNLIEMDSYRGRILETNNSEEYYKSTISSIYNLDNTDYMDYVLEQLEGEWKFNSIPFGGTTDFPPEPNVLRDKAEAEREEKEKEYSDNEFEIKDSKLYYNGVEYINSGMYLNYTQTDPWGHQGSVGTIDKIGNTGINFVFHNNENYISFVYTDFDELYVIDNDGNSKYGYTYYLLFEK